MIKPFLNSQASVCSDTQEPPKNLPMLPVTIRKKHVHHFCAIDVCSDRIDAMATLTCPQLASIGLGLSRCHASKDSQVLLLCVSLRSLVSVLEAFAIAICLGTCLASPIFRHRILPTAHLMAKSLAVEQTSGMAFAASLGATYFRTAHFVR